MAETSTQADRELIREVDGLYVGSLTDEEMESFNRCIADGFAQRTYEGPAGLMGLAKIKVLR